MESTFDYDTGIIGPYVVPVPIVPDMSMMSKNTPSMVRMYEIMLSDDSILAVFANCNRTYIAIHANKLEHHSLCRGEVTSKEKRMLTQIPFKSSIKSNHYNHIGWVKTYQKCKEVYTFPYRLIQDINTGIIPYYNNVTLECTPKVNPEVTIYKELLKTEYTAVYQDALTGELHYIK